nr:signal peptide peptidase SppA [Anaplasma platys]
MFGNSYIARVNVEGAISRNRSRDVLMEKIARDDAIKAVLLRIDSPGGTVGDSEVLYQQLRDIAAKKPVVAVMGNVAASGGYMIALAADHVVARNGTITGSIGVRSNYIGVSQIAKNLGITLRTIKTSEHKGAGSPFEEMSEGSIKLMQEVVDDFHRFFVGLVMAHRNMTEAEALKVSDGRVFTGSQAYNAGLIDEIGGEHEALEWLKEHKEVDINIPVRDLEYRHGIMNAEGLLSMLSTAFAEFLYHGSV